VKNYRFSIICPHYDQSITDELFLEGMQSLDNSSYKNFEVLIYHDGPTSRPIPDLSKFSFKYRYKATNTRYNDWGHSLRDLGIREAEGEYIVHFNPDNIISEIGLQAISDTIDKIRFIHDNFSEETFTSYDSIKDDVIVSPVILEGTLNFGPPNNEKGLNCLQRTFNPSDIAFLLGVPPSPNQIDCMQLVAKRSVWLTEGGWYDKSEKSDGVIYHRLGYKYGYVGCGVPIGVHR